MSDYTMEKALSSMTLFYSKSTGEIKNYCGGMQDMSFFGDDEADFSLIWDFIHVAHDADVLNNTSMYKIEDGEIVLKPMKHKAKYRVASI